MPTSCTWMQKNPLAFQGLDNSYLDKIETTPAMGQFFIIYFSLLMAAA